MRSGIRPTSQGFWIVTREKIMSNQDEETKETDDTTAAWETMRQLSRWNRTEGWPGMDTAAAPQLPIARPNGTPFLKPDLSKLSAGNVSKSFLDKLNQHRLTHPLSLADLQNCVDCDDRGHFDVERPILVDNQYTGEIITVRKACRCEKGHEAGRQWRKICEYCEFGILADGIACRECYTGKELQSQADTLITAWRQRKVNELLAKSDMPDALRECTFDNFKKFSSDLNHACLTVMDAARDGISLYIYNAATGVGKTHLAAAYLNYWMSEGRDGVIVTMPDLMGSLYDTVRGDGGDEKWNERLHRYAGATLLVIDDLGKEKPTAKSLEALFTILDYRVRHRLTTVVSSNYSFERLAARYEKANGADVEAVSPIISRLSRFQPVTWQANDYRAIQQTTEKEAIDLWD
jgi:DNA replication protein DnaC